MRVLFLPVHFADSARAGRRGIRFSHGTCVDDDLVHPATNTEPDGTFQPHQKEANTTKIERNVTGDVVIGDQHHREGKDDPDSPSEALLDGTYIVWFLVDDEKSSKDSKWAQWSQASEDAEGEVYKEKGGDYLDRGVLLGEKSARKGIRASSQHQPGGGTNCSFVDYRIGCGSTADLQPWYRFSESIPGRGQKRRFRCGGFSVITQSITFIWFQILEDKRDIDIDLILG